MLPRGKTYSDTPFTLVPESRTRKSKSHSEARMPSPAFSSTNHNARLGARINLTSRCSHSRHECQHQKHRVESTHTQTKILLFRRSAMCVQQFDDSRVQQIALDNEIRFGLHRYENQDIRCLELSLVYIVYLHNPYIKYSLDCARGK